MKKKHGKSASQIHDGEVAQRCERCERFERAQKYYLQSILDINRRLHRKPLQTQLLECVKMSLAYVRDAEHRGSLHPVYGPAEHLQRAMQDVLRNAGVSEQELDAIYELPYDERWAEDDSNFHELVFARNKRECCCAVDGCGRTGK